MRLLRLILVLVHKTQGVSKRKYSSNDIESKALTHTLTCGAYWVEMRLKHGALRDIGYRLVQGQGDSGRGSINFIVVSLCS